MFDAPDQKVWCNTRRGRFVMHTRSSRECYLKVYWQPNGTPELMVLCRTYGSPWKWNVTALPEEFLEDLLSFLRFKQDRTNYYLNEREIAPILAKFQHAQTKV